jgi:hypothetical protein
VRWKWDNVTGKTLTRRRGRERESMVIGVNRAGKELLSEGLQAAGTLYQRT